MSFRSTQVTSILEADDDLPKPSNRPKDLTHLDLDGNVFEVPTFTMKQIYEAIPRHCFEPSLTRGLLYVLRDFLYLGSAAYLTYHFVPVLASPYLRGICYGIYTVIAGMIMTGIWILAHECGHGAFSKTKTINNTVGFLLHSFLLCPYFSWKISHSHHHKATGDLQRDNVFIPHTRESFVKKKLGDDVDPMTVESISEDAPLVILYRCILHQLLAWPLYMLDNLGGQEGHRGFPTHSHFWFGQNNAMFKKSELRLIFYSDMGVLAMAFALYLAVRVTGWTNVLLFYGVPYLWLNHWVVLITFLQHTDGKLPHFSRSQWTFARGAAATIDRNFGVIDTHIFHHILGTHVLHHLVSTIPFYHAQEATKAVQKVMGKHYYEDRETNILHAFYTNMRDCQFVEETPGMEGSGVFMFRNLHGGGVKTRNRRADAEGFTKKQALRPFPR